MSISSDLTKVMRFLKARTPEQLVRKQLKNNIENSITYKYHIVYDGKSWFAWYMADASDLLKLPETRQI